uniref:cholesterol 7-desaturase nvd-like n=2 Tax=Styela clava TaxID=7725 RepID=UPI00193A342F|nr:cholesterol 7-desaturase nvd-like [Styela clava]
MASHKSEMTSSNNDIISPEFVATSITIFAVVFSSYVTYYVIKRIWRIVYYLYDLIFLPYELIRPLGSVGYTNPESYEMTQRQIVNLVRRRRKQGLEIPPVYPNGWFRIMDSRFLKKGEVKQVTAMGENLIAFRGKSGNVSVMDAYCTHMGANLGVGGRVSGDCIQCPFHGWKFNMEGKCVEVPYSDKLPKNGDMKTWHSREMNGNIYIWYHCDGTDPEWEMPSVPQVDKQQYAYAGRIEHHINTHIQDIPENGYDEPHLNYLHQPLVLAGVNLATHFDSKFNLAGNIMETDYSTMLQTGEKHVAKISLLHVFEVFSRWRMVYVNFQIYQIGPGVVHLHVTTPVGKIVIIQNITPVEPMDQILTHALFKPWYIPNIIAKAVLWGLTVQVDRDLMVWNNRRILAKPLFLKEEKVQKTFRRWYKQFYTDNSPRLGDTKKEGDLDW